MLVRTETYELEGNYHSMYDYSSDMKNVELADLLLVATGEGSNRFAFFLCMIQPDRARKPLCFLQNKNEICDKLIPFLTRSGIVTENCPLNFTMAIYIFVICNKIYCRDL